MKASGIRQDRAAGERLFLVSVYVFIAVFTVFALFPIWLVFITENNEMTATSARITSPKNSFIR
jgi:hypothetical protein